MGKKRDRRKAQAAWLLVILLLFTASCSLRPRLKEPHTLYSGKFLLIRGKEKESGSWEAIEVKGKISKIYLYTSMGFPLAVIERENRHLKIKASEKVELSKETQEEILLLLDILPDIARKDRSTAVVSGFIVEKRGKIIVIFGKRNLLKIKLEKVTPHQHHQEG